jgi:NADPH:quinone reductase-like Zn-dependent oxidoreductase
MNANDTVTDARAVPTTPTTMRAVTQTGYAGPETLTTTTVEVPTPAATQVLIEVAAAGIDRGVWHLVTGRPYLVRLAGFGLRAPKQKIPGLDVAGRVVAVGSEVIRFRPGDRVFGIGTGTYAEYALAEQDKLSHTPETVTDEQAAVAAISGGTALQAVVDLGQVQQSQRVLVIGASGGVGSYAVQIAVAHGAIVTGVSSAAKADFVRDLGAKHVIAYDRHDLDAEGVAYDLVVSTGGLAPVRELRRLLAPTGTLVIVGAEGGGSITGGIGRQLRAMLWSPFVKQRLTALMAREHHEVIDRLAEHLDDGSVVPAIGRTVTLDEVAATLADLESGAIRGKAVVRIGGRA